MFFGVTLQTVSTQQQSKAHRLLFITGKNVQYGVLTTAALLKHNHSNLLPVKLKGTKTLNSSDLFLPP